MQAVERIQNRNSSQNFWLHVAFQAVHGGQHRSETDACDLLPLTADNRAANGFRNAGYGSALHSLDHGVRNITDALHSAQMWENSLFVLTADNGGDNPVGAASNYPLVGRKCLSWEGGTRTYAFVAGGLIPPARRGTVNNQLMHVADWCRLRLHHSRCRDSATF
jgi:arylsulfatase A-like enzyme